MIRVLFGEGKLVKARPVVNTLAPLFFTTSAPLPSG
jgi:hypothetical protein